MITKDLIGARFGKLLVSAIKGSKRESQTSSRKMWLCKCDCGKERIVSTYKLTSGHTVSCGQPQCRSDYRGRAKVSSTYSSWRNMLSRCSLPSSPAFSHYQKRGITVCALWKDFDNFLSDMGERPKGTTLDRWPDNDGNYKPGNCRWATKTQQANNRLTNRRFTYRGTDYTFSELVRATGASYETLRVRLIRPGGWSVEDAIETPTIPRNLRKAGLSKRD